MLRFSADGRFIATGEAMSTVWVWDAETGAELLRLTGHTGRLSTLVFSPDGSSILTASDDQTARIWDISDLVNRP